MSHLLWFDFYRSNHNCTRTHYTFNDLARCLWPWADAIYGDGQYAATHVHVPLIGIGPARFVVYLYPRTRDIPKHLDYACDDDGTIHCDNAQFIMFPSSPQESVTNLNVVRKKAA